MGFPLIQKSTEGKPEEEVKDLKEAIANAISRYRIEGVVTGAIESVYQSQRIQRVCNQLGTWCFNPLWKRNQKELLEELVTKRFKAIISGVFAYPLDGTWLGKEIDRDVIAKLVALQEKVGLSPSGEGGEIETTVLDAPLFRKKIEVQDFEVKFSGNSGVFSIKKARLVPK
jgi:predicted ATP pyrophosphatase (TIGR00289 family)